MKSTGILIIGVIYNTYPETLRYLESLRSIQGEDFTLILVDNSERPAPSSFLDKIRKVPFTEYMKSERNMGYFHGAWEGLKHYLRVNTAYPEWILVTNVDIVFTAGFFSKLREYKDHQIPEVIAPAIISQRWNADYNPKLQKRYTKRELQFYLFLYSSFILHNLFLLLAYLKKWIRGRSHPGVNGAPGGSVRQKKIYAPHGSCIVFNKSYFLSGGTLELPNFLFGEEILVAETAAQLGLDVLYDPEMVIFDHEHASTGFFISPKVNKYNREAVKAILERYYT